MSGHYFKFNFDASAWREAAGFGNQTQNWGTYENIKVAAKKKIRIDSDQPINTALFDELVVLEINGVPTAEGLKERLNNHPYFVKEGEMKPIIDFINRL